MKGKTLIRRWLTSTLFSLLVIFVSTVHATSLNAEDNRTARATESKSARPNPTGDATGLSVAFRNATEVIRPAVVSIRANQQPNFGIFSAQPILPDPWQGYVDYGLSQINTFQRTRAGVAGPQPLPQPSAAGVIVGRDGYLLTSCDVVAGANQFIVKTHTNTEYPAKLTRKDPKTGLAILKIDSPHVDLPAAQLADFDTVRVGDWVLAIGGPAENTVSAGIISALSMNAEADGGRQTSLYTDALISPANHGGPLVNLRGEVVGINCFKATEGTESREFGVAVPSNLAQQMLDGLVPVRAIASRRSSAEQSCGEEMMNWINQAGISENSSVDGLGTFEWASRVRDFASRLKTLVTEYSQRVARHGSPSIVQPDGAPAPVGVRFSPEFSQNRSSEKATNKN